MTNKILFLLTLVAIALVVLGGWRWADERADRAVWENLASHQPSFPDQFDYAMLQGLPLAAQRFFRFAIKPGTPLTTVAEISMEGQFSLGSKAEPNYMPMRAQQILAPPYGFVWQLQAADGLVRMSGSDAAEDGNSWSRFWLFDLLPVARAGRNPDHARSAFGRYVAEAVLWTPAAILPGDNIRWESISESMARVTMTHLKMEQSVDLTVAPDGQLSRVSFQRWSNANRRKEYRLQPFGGYLSAYRDFGGFRLPTRVEAGNLFETDDYFPFFRVQVSAIQFPARQGD